jgi:hypothetical protein
MRRPRGGRLLIMEKTISFACSSAAAWARALNILSSVTKVPSTAEITAEHLNGSGRGRRDHVESGLRKGCAFRCQPAKRGSLTERRPRVEIDRAQWLSPPPAVFGDLSLYGGAKGGSHPPSLAAV